MTLNVSKSYYAPTTGTTTTTNHPPDNKTKFRRGDKNLKPIIQDGESTVSMVFLDRVL